MGCRPGCTERCTCAKLTNVLAAACVLALVPAAYVAYELYLKPWGKQQLTNAPSNSVDDLACAACAGVNRAFPVAAGVTSGFSSFEAQLANNGGRVVSTLAAAGVAIGGSSLVIALVQALVHSPVSNARNATDSSSSSTISSVGFDALLMLAHGQFVTLLGSLQLRGAPLFYLEFCKSFAWMNLQLLGPHEAQRTPVMLATATDNDLRAVHGVRRYAQLVGIDPNDLFGYTCLAVTVAFAAIVALFLLVRCSVRLCKREPSSTTACLDTCVIWFAILLLSTLQYVLAMTSSFGIYDALALRHASRSVGTLVLAIVVLVGACVGFVAFGVLKVTQRRLEPDGLSTDAPPECRLVQCKYSVYYKDYTNANAFFFVAKFGLEIGSGVVVGTVQNPMVQIGLLVAFNVSVVVLTILREPFVKRQCYYLSIVSGTVRLVLLLLSAMQLSVDTFPQHVRDNAAEIVIGLNVLLCTCLLMHQIYGVTTALCKWCQATSSISFRPFSLPSWLAMSQSRSSGNGNGTNAWRSRSRNAKAGSSSSHCRNDTEPRFTLQQLIAAKIRGDPPAITTPPMHGTPPPSREPYQGNPSHRFV